MASLTKKELLQIIALGESDRVEFKESLSGEASRRIREAICAFANDLPDHKVPGLVFVGVKDDGTIGNLSVDLPDHKVPGLVFVGVKDDGTIGNLSVADRLLQQLADMKTDGNILPPPSLSVEKRVLKGGEVAVISVQPSDSPPVRFKGAIHVRTGPRRGLATAQDERILNEKRRHGDRPFDIQPIRSAGLSDLNLTQFANEYLVQAFSDEILAANDRSLNEQLAATKMIVALDQPTATVLGLLTIGKNPQDFLPGAYVQFLRIDGRELSDDIIDSEDMRGAIPDLLRRINDKLISHNRTAVAIATGTVEQRAALYPIEALQQIIWNAVMHRTYEGTHTPVRITWFDDRIEIMSPGGAFGTVNAENFGQPGFTDYRNPNLADAMKTLGYVQRFGVGISIAKRQLADAGHPEAEFDISDNFVCVTIRQLRENAK